jgi:lipopolysaccharide/colanic/teichoic acid biosynthesis glycosyltransferase
MTSMQHGMKRAFDSVVSSIGLALILVPIVVVSILVKLSSSGPVFFLQKRVGRFGKLFTVVKFRTMRVNSSEMGFITSAGDERITSFGRILRSLKLDELPQLWNVFIGKMSFVGPRPDVPGYADLLKGDDRKILLLRPGITGPASLYFKDEERILAREDDPVKYNDTVIWPKKVELNLDYYYHWNFWKDIGYILVTILPVTNRFLNIIPQQGR